MIRVVKCERVPQSLIKTKSYAGEDTKKQLMEDQREKCYICERYLETDFTIEHLKCEKLFTKLILEWTNLYMACSYCNGKKGEKFNDMLDPSQVNIEEEIQQSIDFRKKKAVFAAKTKSAEHDETISFLERVFNGTGMMRNLKEDRFFNRAMHEVNDFLNDVNNYKLNPSQDTEKVVRDELSIKEEFLGFKYWVIKNDNQLNQVFSNDIVWNKK